MPLMSRGEDDSSQRAAGVSLGAGQAKHQRHLHRAGGVSGLIRAAGVDQPAFASWSTLVGLPVCSWQNEALLGSNIRRLVIGRILAKQEYRGFGFKGVLAVGRGLLPCIIPADLYSRFALTVVVFVPLLGLHNLFVFTAQEGQSCENDNNCLVPDISDLNGGGPIIPGAFVYRTASWSGSVSPVQVWSGAVTLAV